MRTGTDTYEVALKPLAGNEVLSVTSISKKFGKKVVLDDFSLTLHKGESLAILGRSGSGKSVLIKCIIGLLTPEAGSINVLGNNVLSLDKEGLDRLRTRVGFLFQSNALYDSMSVRQNLEFPMRRHLGKLTTEVLNEKVLTALKNVGLENTVDLMPAELSGGMQKRIALARTLIMNPEIMMYDEPTTGLDPITGKEISNLIVEIQRKYDTSSITISHDMKCVEIIADRILVLIDGKCYAEGTFDTLKQSGDTKVKQFFE
jgi:phospholipid/cholesterol/gamma-HCH transport system ATP-binding protein